jgi:hypothetical protein
VLASGIYKKISSFEVHKTEHDNEPGLDFVEASKRRENGTFPGDGHVTCRGVRQMGGSPFN